MPFVAVEGIDGAGKSSVSTALYDHYPNAVRSVFPDAERSAGRVIRQLLAEDMDDISPSRSERVELLGAWLFISDHIDQWESEISPALAEEKLVISDRYISSLYATQGVTLQSRFDDAVAVLQDLVAEADTGTPNRTLWIDVPVDVAVSRLEPEELDQYESPDILKQKRSVYRRLSEETDRFVRIDGTQAESDVLEDALSAVDPLVDG